MKVRIEHARALAGTVRVPGDKSISHRALLLAAMSGGPCRIEGLGPGGDVRSTVSCLRSLGVRIEPDGEAVMVQGLLRAPEQTLDAGNSGTTARLLAGVLAGVGIGATIDGDASLRRRPMARVLQPLRAMGARIDGDSLPFSLKPGQGLVGRNHDLPVASAQVKSALLLAGLGAQGTTCVYEPEASRDHTERLLPLFGVEVRRGCVTGPARLIAPSRIAVPGDVSSAAFLLAAALLAPAGDVTVTGVGLNPTRTGLLRVLARMGADVQVKITQEGYEPTGTLRARSSELAGTTIDPWELPSLVDEVPVLAVLATQARGRTTIRGAAELRVKESDRLHAMATSLEALGARIQERPDGLEIEGPTPLIGCPVDASDDHRVAMALAVAGLSASGSTTIDGAGWVDISFPGYFQTLHDLSS